MVAPSHTCRVQVRTKLQKAIAGELEAAADDEDEEKFVTVEEEEEAISSSKYALSTLYLWRECTIHASTYGLDGHHASSLLFIWLRYVPYLAINQTDARAIFSHSAVACLCMQKSSKPVFILGWVHLYWPLL
jgi:hypothetical protein